MERLWRVHRSTVPSPDAQQRWDLAYQFLLQWSSYPEAADLPAFGYHQEEQHGNCDLCPSLDTTPTADADD